MELQETKIQFMKRMPYSILTWFPTLFYCANLYRMTNHSSLPYIVLLAICGLVGLGVGLFSRMPCKNILIFTYAIFVITGILNYLTIGNLVFNEILSDVLYIGIAVLMISFPMTYMQGVVTFCVNIGVFVYGYLTGAGTHDFLTSSGNYISVLAIIATSLYYVTIQNSQHVFRVIDVVPALLSFLIAVWAKGRGGILSCTLLLVLILAYYVKVYVTRDARRCLLIVIIVAVVVGYLLIHNVNLIDQFFKLGKWSTKGTNTNDRAIIWNSYFNKVKGNFIYFFNGAPLHQIQIINDFNNNTHNSFIQLHATHGIIAFAVLIVESIKAVLAFMKKRKYLMVIVFLVMVVRGMTDKFVFDQYGMPIMIYLILYQYYERYISTQVDVLKKMNQMHNSKWRKTYEAF